MKEGSSARNTSRSKYRTLSEVMSQLSHKIDLTSPLKLFPKQKVFGGGEDYCLEEKLKDFAKEKKKPPSILTEKSVINLCKPLKLGSRIRKIQRMSIINANHMEICKCYTWSCFRLEP